MNNLRVVQWATGNIGTRTLKAVILTTADLPQVIADLG